MKDKMKNTLEQEVELLGRSVSVLLIAGLLVVGGASAALLNSFGEITGDADVEQSVILDEQTVAQPEVSTFDESIVAGESIEGDNFDVENQASVPVDIDFTTTTEEFNPSEEGIDYEYTLLNTFSEARNDDDNGDDNSAETEVIRDGDSFAVRAQADAQNLEEDGGDTVAKAGVFFDVENNNADVSDQSITVDYEVGEADEDPADEDNQGPDWFVVVFEDGGETYTAIDPTAHVESGTGYTMSDDAPVFDEDETPQESASDYDNVDVTYVGVETGSERSNEGTYELIYQEVEYESTDLVDERTYKVDSEGQEDEVTLSPETDYTFGSHLDTSVYLEPNSEYSVTTDLATGEEE